MNSSDGESSSDGSMKRFKSVVKKVHQDSSDQYQSESGSSIKRNNDRKREHHSERQRSSYDEDHPDKRRKRHMDGKENTNERIQNDRYDRQDEKRRSKGNHRRSRSPSSDHEIRKDRRDNKRHLSMPKDNTNEATDKGPGKQNKASLPDIMTRAGGAYIPPARLKMMQEGITDKSSSAYQRIAWEALKKSINGLVNKVNVANIANIVQELFEENIIRGRGLLCQSVMRAQVASPMFTNVYAALIAIVNTKFPKIGELILHRLILQFRRAYRRNDKNVCLNSARFIAHLVNQQVAHELIALELLTLLLQNPNDDSVEVSVAFLKEAGSKLTEVSPRGLNAVFERLRSILNEGSIDKRVQYMLEVMFAIRKDGFKDHPAVISDLDLVEEEDQITHLLRLDDDGPTEELLNVFKHDPDYIESEEKYKQIKKEIIGNEESDHSSGEDDSQDDDDDDDGELEDEADQGEGKMEIIDKTETNLVALRRTIYLTIQSSLDYEECAHKMMKMQLKPGQEYNSGYFEEKAEDSYDS